MISVVVLTKNEEKNVGRCIESLLWCDPLSQGYGEASEIIVIDDYSSDNTVKIARKLGARIYKRHLNNNFAGQRNYGLAKAKGDWVLFIDADEIISKKLKLEILSRSDKLRLSALQNDRVGYYIKRRDVFMGRELKYGETGNAKFLRLARKGAGRWKRAVHEYWDPSQSSGQALRIGELINPILHYPHQTIGEFIEDIDRYSTIHAEENKRSLSLRDKEGIKKIVFWKIIIWPAGKFFINYFVKLGFLDGIPGFIMAVMMSFHSFLSWSKVCLF